MDKPKITPSRIILFDLDHTLHSPDLFRKLYRSRVLNHFAVNETDFENARESYDRSLKERRFFHPHTYTKHLAAKLGLEHNALKKHYYEKTNYANSLFEETKKVLEKLNQKFILGIFSEGGIVNQMKKIKHGELLHYFNPTYLYIYANKRTSRVINSLPRKAIIIDDNPDVIDILLKREDLVPIWLNRKDQTNHPKAYTIHSLSDILQLC